MAAVSLSRTFRALRHRNFRLFFIGQGLSMMGTWLQQVAMGWLTYRITGSAWLLGAVAFCANIGILLFGTWAGVLAAIVLVLGIAQVPALIITLPAIGWIWSAGTYSTGAATLYSILLLVAGMADNVLKPLMLGRGVDAPMPVILIGALGGMAVAGILGMFVGAVLLALGYQIFMGWVDTDPDAGKSVVTSETPAAV